MKKLGLVLVAMFLIGFVMAQSNIGTVNQFGSNIGSVLQTGSGNNGTIQQGFLGADVFNNHAPSYPGDWIQGSYIVQTGVDNTATVTVRTSDNGTSISQIGDNNDAIQDVGSYLEETTSSTKMGLDIDQSGSGNSATQKTFKNFGNYGIQGMTIVQTGSNNIADQVSVGGMSNIQTISQVGSNNNNEQASGNVFPGSKTLGLPFTFSNQSGGVITQPITQYSNQQFGSAIIDVVGSNNNTYQFQEFVVWGGGNNDANLNLSGSTNNVVQGQLGENNNSKIDLVGSSNLVTTKQLGDNNHSVIYLNGSSNKIVTDQDGDFNNQLGSSTDVYVWGDSNDVTALQKGNYNNSDIQIVGSKNIVLTDQLLDHNTATVNQTGNLNTATVIQH